MRYIQSDTPDWHYEFFFFLTCVVYLKNVLLAINRAQVKLHETYIELVSHDRNQWCPWQLGSKTCRKICIFAVHFFPLFTFQCCIVKRPERLQSLNPRKIDLTVNWKGKERHLREVGRPVAHFSIWKKSSFKNFKKYDFCWFPKKYF